MTLLRALLGHCWEAGRIVGGWIQHKREKAIICILQRQKEVNTNLHQTISQLQLWQLPYLPL